MELKEFAELVFLMREKQKEYFKTRHPGALYASKELEKMVDARIKLIVTPEKESQQQTLF